MGDDENAPQHLNSGTFFRCRDAPCHGNCRIGGGGGQGRTGQENWGGSPARGPKDGGEAGRTARPVSRPSGPLTQVHQTHLGAHRHPASPIPSSPLGLPFGASVISKAEGRVRKCLPPPFSPRPLTDIQPGQKYQGRDRRDQWPGTPFWTLIL